MTHTEHKAKKATLYDAFAASGKALANGTRLQLLDLLAQGERTVESIARATDLNLTTASAHLQTLKAAGFVTTRRDGVRIFYRLSGDDIAELLALLRSVAARHQPRVGPARDDYLGSDDGTDEIDRDELQRRIDADDTVVILDVRPVEEYDAGHIPGAVSIPVDELAERITELPEDRDVVVYCRGEYCVMAYDAARLLAADGRRAIRLNDGMLEWRLADLPVARR
ncbi:ArsR/SmtB family transcription factor [Gordonia rhizosphera]|uniref:Putative ArsR family transcriptional regulator n=1 Tax=Gordonia rhizosphera NBRC 16068 TaxID=1108045 RepID=K6WVP7_9ACTN|nr:metalloregulator ArsR/SmtB family transcription factor [Gordonia rhizosphera]GAB90629.1 putative ArsR family transcriptional regulator [Gordonia rhizosphera NBRC 16068]